MVALGRFAPREFPLRRIPIPSAVSISAGGYSVCQLPMKKASINGRPALLRSNASLYSLLPGFAGYMEIDSVGIVGALNARGEIIGLSWQELQEDDKVCVEQDLIMC
jgi:hypothetical protein